MLNQKFHLFYIKLKLGNRLHFPKIALNNDRQTRMMKKVDGGPSDGIYESINQTLWGCLKGKTEKYRVWTQLTGLHRLPSLDLTYY